MIVLIMGPQGCGKGTQAKLLQQETNLTHVSFGDVFRSEIQKHSSRSKKIRRYTEKGKLVPEKINDEILKEVFEQHPENIILDGYPRDEYQLSMLQSQVDVDAVLYIDISEEESVKRLSRRRICTATNEIFIENKISEEDRKKCKEQGGRIIQREDDKPQAIKKRLAIFFDQTKPLIHAMKKENIPILRIDGEQEIDAVHKEIIEALQKYVLTN